MFEDCLTRWELTPDGEPIITSTSQLLPVRFQGRPAMLKIAVEPEEKPGGRLMHWWGGWGAAGVLALDGDAVLLERATGSSSLTAMAQDGHDDEACRIICGVVTRLHAPRHSPAPEAVSLTTWFRDLALAAEAHGGILTLCAETAHALLSSPQETVMLHGDVHHGNILDFGPRGWLAIDPKCLIGERGFDYANLFCNPDVRTAAAPGTVAHRADIIAEAAGLDRQRLLRWVLAWAGLSAVWMLDDGEVPDSQFEVAAQAAAELRGKTKREAN